jgi:precorrin-6A/cobalt-precorrin-6A reductase
LRSAASRRRLSRRRHARALRRCRSRPAAAASAATRASRLLDTHPIRAVIDATHPFAARITARTHAICARRGLPLLRLERPRLDARSGDRWTFVADESEAAALIPPTAVVSWPRPAVAARLAGLCAARVHLRVIDRPEGRFPFPGGYVVGRPPFDRDSERALLALLGVTHLVVKDSGAAEARAKLDAARDLGLSVILLRRPPRPRWLADGRDGGGGARLGREGCPSVPARLTLAP